MDAAENVGTFILAQPDGTRKKAAISKSENLTFGNLGSLIAANVENPGDFQAKMLQEFKKLHESSPASDEATKAYLSQVADLTHIIYGKRYEEHEQQREDLALDPSESNLFDKQNREIDKEILSSSDSLLAKIDHFVKNGLNNWKTLRTGARNFVDWPMRLVHASTKNASEHKHARMKRKLAKKETKVQDGTNLHGIEKLINNRHKTVAASYAKKLTTTNPRRLTLEQKRTTLMSTI